LPNPSVVPRAMASSTARAGGTPSTCISQPANIPVAPPIAPTDRFMSPIDSTTIWAKPMVTAIAAERSRKNTLKSEVKPVAKTEKKIQKPAVMMSSASSPSVRRRPVPRGSVSRVRTATVRVALIPPSDD